MNTGKKTAAYLLFIALPLILRHVYHFWCTRHASRRLQKRGITSVALWFVSYIILAAGVFGKICRSKSVRWSFWAGGVMLWGACIGRMISIRQLGRAFSEFIDIRPAQRLIDTGIYAHVRHPLHYFLLLEMVAMAVVIGSVWSWSLIALSTGVLFFRELDEEKALEQAFGKKYQDYRKHAVALVDIISRRS